MRATLKLLSPAPETGLNYFLLSCVLDADELAATDIIPILSAKINRIFDGVEVQTRKSQACFQII